MSALVSIIIPVYNIEKYIANCLNSIINQTYKNIEIICIDDGSKDKSGEIICKMAENDSRIIYIYQENSGVSVARNNGLSRVSGEYVMFADGDDYMHYQAVEILVKCIEENNCNMVFSGSITTGKMMEQMDPIEKYTMIPLEEKHLFGIGSDRAVWAKIFRKSVVGEIEFPVGITNSEDFNYMIRLLYKSKENLGFRIDCNLYYYYMRGDSASFHDFSEKNITEIVVNELNADFFSDKKDCYLKSYSLISLIRSILFVRTKSIGSKFEKKVKASAKSVWKRWHRIFLKSNGISLKDKVMFTAFYYSRHLYELARLIQDPTMKQFYKDRKKNRS